MGTLGSWGVLRRSSIFNYRLSHDPASVPTNHVDALPT